MVEPVWLTERAVFFFLTNLVKEELPSIKLYYILKLFNFNLLFPGLYPTLFLKLFTQSQLSIYLIYNSLTSYHLLIKSLYIQSLFFVQ